MGSTSQAQPDTTETVEEETTDANSVEPYSTERIPEQNEFTSKEEVVNQDTLEEDTDTTAIAFEEAPTTEEAFAESFEAETVSVTPKENEGEHSTSEEEITTIAADLLTNPGEDDPEGAFQDETTLDKITEDEMVDQANNTQDILSEEETTRNNKEITEESDEVTTEASSNVIMTHTYVMKERENSSLIETGEISTEIPKPDAAVPNLLDFVNQNFNEADNIIFDTNEIVPLKAPEDGIQEERTFYRTEKSISKVVTEISV